MKPEPLTKNKIYNGIRKYIRKNYEPKKFADEWIDVWDEFEILDSELGIIDFIFKKVQERLQYLLQEIEKEIAKSKEKETKFEKQNEIVGTSHEIGCIDGLVKAKDIIKKAFGEIE